MSSNIDPKILKRMNKEDTFLQAQSRSSRRVKLERGQNWIVRFLPAQLGPDGLWFARIARHWLYKLPIICPRNTAEDFGGNPEFECPVCLMADELNESADEDTRNFGYKSRANPQFLTYCIVWEKEGVEQSLAEILNPYEFWHFRTTWEELKGFYVAGGRKCANSVLDYAQGNDFSVNKTAKGLRLDKQDSSPIFDSKEPKYEEWIKKIESALKTPKVVIPTQEQLDVFTRKLMEAGNRGGVEEEAPRSRRRDRGGDEESGFRRRRPEAEEGEDDLPYEKPTRQAARPTSRRPAAEEEPEQEEQPAPRRRPAAEEPAPEPAPRARRAAPEPEAAPAARRPAPTPVRQAARQVQPEPEDGEPEAGEAAEPEAGEAAEPEAADAEERPAARLPATQRRGLPPTARRAASEAANSTPQEDAEEEQLPEESVDAAPPESDEPPPVARKGGQAAAIGARLKTLGRNA